MAKKKEQEAKDQAKASQDKGVGVDVDPRVLKAIAEAEAQRAAAAGPAGAEDKVKELEGQMESIIRRARQLADTAGDDLQARQTENELRRDFEGLISILGSVGRISREDMKKLKDAAFGPLSFWVTDMLPVEEAEAPELLELYGTGAWIIRGNLREGKQEAFARLNRAMEDVFQNRLVAFMVPDPMPSDATRADANTEDRPAFIILQREMAEPPPTAGWQIFFAAVLLLLTAASHFQLGVVANVTRLPPEALQALANPDNFNPDAPIPGMTEEDIVNFVLSAVPIAAFTFGSNMAHELGHRVAAAVRGVRLGASYFLPNGQLGSFGAITPIKSVTRNYDDLWDVAFAGPLAGGLVSLSLFLFGLAASAADASAGAEAAAALVPVPTPLFQGSLLLGGMCRAFLGDAAFTGTTVGLHPAAIAGWCGLVTTCLNLLPVGQTDGGRMAQATFGRNGLNLTSFFTYVGLALGVLGSSLALPYGLAVLILQRNPERLVQDQVTLAAEGKRAVTAVAIAFAILTLVPVAPELLQSAGGLSPGGPFM